MRALCVCEHRTLHRIDGYIEYHLMKLCQWKWMITYGSWHKEHKGGEGCVCVYVNNTSRDGSIEDENVNACALYYAISI